MRELLFLFIIILVGCKKEPIEPIALIEPGCIPSSIHFNSSISGSFLDTYTYENDRPKTYGFYEYEYSGDVVSKIIRSTSQFEEYAYDDQNRVISSKEFKKQDGDDDFELVAHYTYDYLGDEVHQSTNELNGKVQILHRNIESSNIDSLITFDKDGVLVRSEYYEYDDKHNVFTNDLTPKFHYHIWLRKSTPNNVIKYLLIRPNVIDDPLPRYDVDIIYNEHNFPIQETVNFSSGEITVREISYQNCN